jgi:hypothetical protein
LPALDLQHGALARAIGQIKALGNDAIEPPLPGPEPWSGFAHLSRVRRQSQAMRVADPLEERLQSLAALRERPIEKRLPGLGQQAIEDNELGWRFLGQAINPALCRMKPHLQRIEGLASEADYELTIKNERCMRERPQVCERLGKEARERFARLGFDLGRRARAKRQASEAVPFRLELPSFGVPGQLCNQCRLHWAQRQWNAQLGQGR